MRWSPRYYGCRRVGDTANYKLNGNGKPLISPRYSLRSGHRYCSILAFDPYPHRLPVGWPDFRCGLYADWSSLRFRLRADEVEAPGVRGFFSVGELFAADLRIFALQLNFAESESGL